MQNFKENLHKVKAFAFDVDGVLTDGSILIHPSGELLRSSSTRDGYAINKVAKLGYPIALITGGKSPSVRDRYRDLGITDIYLGTHDKVEAMEDFRFKYNLELEEILYMGDDIPDQEVMQRVGFPTCPADAAPEIQAVSVYISSQPGGKGCVRDVIEQVLKLKEQWLIDKNFKQ